MNFHYLIICATLLLSGCARFQPTRIEKKALSQITAHTSTASTNITACNIYNDYQSPTAHDITTQIRLLSLHITNKTALPISINSKTITPHIMHTDDFAKLTPKTYGCYFVPAIVLGSTGLLFLWQVGLPLAGLLTLFGINQSHRAADRTIASFNEQTLKETQTITPHSTKTFLIAIKHEHYKPILTIPIQTTTTIETCSLHLKKTMNLSFDLV